ncbi:MAG: putative quinol monooxygenase [Phocaeicola sp.]
MIRVNVFIQATEGNHAAVVELGKELVTSSVKEEGCIAYDLFQSATRPDVLLICETWADEATLQAHEETAHFTAIVPKMSALAKMKLEKFTF